MSDNESTMPLRGKKRDLLPDLNKMILDLQYMVPDAAKLELSDNDKASRRLKQSLVEFKNGPFAAFSEKVKAIREEINSKPKRVYGPRKYYFESKAKESTNNQ